MHINWKSLISLIVPIIGIAIPQIAPLIPVITSAIHEAESLKNATGPEKKAHALALVQDAVDATNTLTEPDVLDLDATLDTASKVIDAAVGVANVIKNVQNAAPPAA